MSWTRGELIGAGAFGRVYLGLNNHTGQLMAVKQARMRAGVASMPVRASVLSCVLQMPKGDLCQC